MSVTATEDLSSWLARAANMQPETDALVGPSEQMSYAELAEYALVGSQRLGPQVVGPVLALATRSRWHTALIACAASIARIPLMPLNPLLPATTLKQLLTLAAVKRCWIDSPIIDLPPDVEQCSLDDLTADSGKGLIIDRQQPNQQSDIRLVLATSGSTGSAKAVMLTAANLTVAVIAAKHAIPIGSGDRWLSCLPFFHIGGIAILWRCMEAGATVVIAEKTDPVVLLETLVRERITHVSLVPALLSRLLEQGVPPPPELRAVLVGGAALAGSMALRAKQAGWPLCVSYGMTEAASQIATDCSPGAGIQDGQVGEPLPGFAVEVRAVDARGGGRIWLKGPAVMAGYLNPDLRPGDGLVNGWYPSNDCGRRSEDGRLQILGRLDDVLISGGESIHPEQVESVIAQYAGVKSVAVSARSDPVWGDRLVALVVGQVNLEELEIHCQSRLAGALLPREFILVDALPENATGKPDRAAIRRRLQEQSA